MALTIYQPIKPDGNFHAVEAADVLMTDGTRLSEFNPGSGLPDSSEADNGKVLQIVNGAAQYVEVKNSSVATYIDDYISSALEGDY